MIKTTHISTTGGSKHTLYYSILQGACFSVFQQLTKTIYGLSSAKRYNFLSPFHMSLLSSQFVHLSVFPVHAALQYASAIMFLMRLGRMEDGAFADDNFPEQRSSEHPGRPGGHTHTVLKWQVVHVGPDAHYILYKLCTKYDVQNILLSSLLLGLVCKLLISFSTWFKIVLYLCSRTMFRCQIW